MIVNKVTKPETSGKIKASS